MEKSFTDQPNKTVPAKDKKIVGYKEIESNRWVEFSTLCEARLAKTCIISQEYCTPDRCFAKQIIIYAKGFI